MSKILRKGCIIATSIMVSTSLLITTVSADTINNVEVEQSEVESAQAEPTGNEDAPEIEDITSKLNKNGTVTFTVEATGGEFGNGELFYKFYQVDDKGKKIEINQDEGIGQNYSLDNSFVCSKSTGGNYKIEVEVQDSNNNTDMKTAEYKAAAADDDDDDKPGIEEPKESLSLTSFTTNKSTGQVVNTEITLSAKTKDADGDVEYKFEVKDSNNKVTTIKDYSEDSTASWKPSKAGDYTLIVKAKDSREEEVSRTREFKIVEEKDDDTDNKDELTAEVTVSGSKFTANKAIKLSATSEGTEGNDVKYLFTVVGPNGTETIQSYSTKDTAEFTPKEAGNYTFYVTVKADNGTIKSEPLKVVVEAAAGGGDKPGEELPTGDTKALLPLVAIMTLSIGYGIVSMRRKSSK